MNKDLYDIKYQTSNICDAMIRNLNDNFKSVSFEFLKNGDLLLKIILDTRTEVENDYIEDIMTELASMQEHNNVLSPLVEIGNDHLPLKNLVYQKAL